MKPRAGWVYRIGAVRGVPKMASSGRSQKRRYFRTCARHVRPHDSTATTFSFWQRLLPEVRKLQVHALNCRICPHCFQECYAHLAPILPTVFEFRQVLRPRVCKQLLSGERFHLWVAKTEWRHTHPVTFSRVAGELERYGPVPSGYAASGRPRR